MEVLNSTVIIIVIIFTLPYLTTHPFMSGEWEKLFKTDVTDMSVFVYSAPHTTPLPDPSHPPQRMQAGFCWKLNIFSACQTNQGWALLFNTGKTSRNEIQNAALLRNEYIARKILEVHRLDNDISNGCYYICFWKRMMFSLICLILENQLYAIRMPIAQWFVILTPNKPFAKR